MDVRKRIFNLIFTIKKETIINIVDKIPAMLGVDHNGKEIEAADFFLKDLVCMLSQR